jgi:hypothetical protein
MIERKSGYSNQDMVRYCEALLRVVSQTITAKEGRGKSATTRDVLKYPDAKQEIERIQRSCEYYRSAPSFSFRDYQLDIINQGCNILSRHGFLYLAMEVRTGKTLTSLGIAQKIGAKNVLFVTKKKAIGSIEDDYAKLSPDYFICVVNYESLHTVDKEIKWDLIVVDEAHGMGAFPKPSGRALAVKDIIAKNKPKVILMSGTPTPESYSQMYHQVYGIPNNPFKEFKTFYRFCDKYVKVTERKINGMFIRDYSDGKKDILDAMKPYTINYTQGEAGFVCDTREHILMVDMKPSTMALVERLKRDLVVEGKEEVILADTPAKLMTKVHQLCSGTIKFESGNSMIVDRSKAEYIRERFKDRKIGIFYKFKEELQALQDVYGDALTTDLCVFTDTDKSIALQIVSGREGISLRDADCLVYYNIDFSATSYWQSRDRMTTKDRLVSDVYWVFSRGGIEKDIYKVVIGKKDYTINHFKKDEKQKEQVGG